MRKGATFETKKSKEMKIQIEKLSRSFNGTLKDYEVISLLRKLIINIRRKCLKKIFFYQRTFKCKKGTDRIVHPSVPFLLKMKFTLKS